MAKTKETTISNWTLFGADFVAIDLHQYNIDDVICYNSTLTFILDDGKMDEDNLKAVTIITDFWEPCPHCCARETFESISTLFQNISNDITVFDTDGNETDKLDLDELFSEDHLVVDPLDSITTLQ